MTTMYVTYSGDAGTRFDRDYYVRHHLPLVMSAGSARPGKLRRFLACRYRRGTICICECRFRDQGAMRAALVSPETPRVMADVAHFTDAQPAQSLAGPI